MMMKMTRRVSLLMLFLILNSSRRAIGKIVFLQNNPEKCLSGQHNPLDYAAHECYRHVYTRDCLSATIPFKTPLIPLKTIVTCFQCCSRFWLQTVFKLTKGETSLSMVFSAPEFISFISKVAAAPHSRGKNEIINEHIKPPTLMYAESVSHGMSLLTLHYPRKLVLVSSINHTDIRRSRADKKKPGSLLSWWWHSRETCTAPESLVPACPIDRLESGQMLRGSRFTSVADLQTTPRNRSRKLLLTCLILDESPDSCTARLISQLPCKRVVQLPVSREEKRPDSKIRNDYITAVRESSFVTVVANLRQLESSRQQTINSPWIAEALLLGAIPALVSATCSQPLHPPPSNEDGSSHTIPQLPVLFFSWSEVANGTSASIQALFESKLGSLMDSGASLSPLFLPFWLSKLLPLSAIDSHLPRGASRESVFIGRVVPYLRALAAGRSLPNSATTRSTGLPPSKPPVIELVLPRCCEMVSGELAWLAAVLREGGAGLKVSIYYKCPQCLPPSLNLKAYALPGNSTLAGEHPFTAPQLAFIVKTLKTSGGSRSLDSLPPNAALKERPSFDTIVNAKEASAYLRHIIERYDSLANWTFFLHTQPSRHAHTTALVDILRAASSRVPTLSTYASVNFRFFGGAWAHEPRDCLMYLMEYCFGNSTEFGDQRRLPPRNHNSKEFQALKMSEWTAAQFVVKSSGIRLRSKKWWQRLLSVTIGETAIEKCSHRDQTKGTLVASALERLYHNFFLDGSRDPQPLCLPCSNDDSRCLPNDVTHCPPTNAYRSSH